MKKVIVALLSLFLILGVVPVAFATDAEMVSVSSLDALQDAIANAENGDIICITQTIIVSGDVQLGEKEKVIKIHGSENLSTLLHIQGIYGSDCAVSIMNITIDGSSMLAGPKVISESPNDVTFVNVCWSNCSNDGNGAGLCNSGDGTLYLKNCAFENCSAENGGAIYNSIGGNCTVSDSSFSDNQANLAGGAIYSVGELEMEHCSFTLNRSTQGGAIFGAGLKLKDCSFSQNDAQMGGAMYCSGKYLSIDDSAFSENTAVNGGAILSEVETMISSSTITDNSAQIGGGLYLRDATTLIESKTYENCASSYGKDIFASSVVEFQITDYKTLYADVLTQKNLDSWAWYIDTPEHSYTEEIMAETNSPLLAPALAFIMWDSTQDITPEPKPTPTSKPSHASVNKVTRQNPIQCGEFELSRVKVSEYMDFASQFVAPGERITRGQAAYLICSFGTDVRSSQACDAFADINTSPYRDSINELAASRIFVGQANGYFKPDSEISIGQLLTVLTRFVEQKKMGNCCFADSTHWAASAAETACAYGWIPDIPVNLDSPATSDYFINLLSKLVELK